MKNVSEKLKTIDSMQEILKAIDLYDSLISTMISFGTTNFTTHKIDIYNRVIKRLNNIYDNLKAKL